MIFISTRSVSVNTVLYLFSLTFNHLKSKYDDLFEKISYEPNDWQPDENFVCNFKYSENNENKINYNLLDIVQPLVYEMKSFMQFPSGFCALNNNEFAITDTAKNEILIFDKELNNLKLCVKEIEEHVFNSPSNIIMDSNFKNVYISDFWNGRILIVNDTFSKVKRVIDCLQLNLESFYPIDFTLHEDCVFALDRMNRKVIKFNPSKTCSLNEITLTKS